jgi:hypothetical protein
MKPKKWIWIKDNLINTNEVLRIECRKETMEIIVHYRNAKNNYEHGWGGTFKDKTEFNFRCSEISNILTQGE